MTIPGLAIGRVVLYTAYDRTQYAGVISEIKDANEGICSLHLFVPSGIKVVTNIVMDADGDPNTWYWPARV